MKTTNRLMDIMKEHLFRMPAEEQGLFEQLFLGVRRARKATERLIEIHGHGCECEYCYTLPGLLWALRSGEDLIGFTLPCQLACKIDSQEPRDDDDD